ncbi:hypothetical protein ACLOJK_014170 [Asimina triloba]
MSETHELGGSTVAVDRATPKEDSRFYRTSSNFPMMPYTHPQFHLSGCTDIHSRTACSGSQSDQPLSSVVFSAQGRVCSDSGQASMSAPVRIEKKMFIGRVPVEATTEDLHAYFSQFGWVLDVYLPKDARKSSHRGFGFVTFVDEASAARVARLRHFLFGREIAVESASPTDRMLGSRQMPSNELSLLAGEKNLLSDVPSVATENCKTACSSASSTGKWGKKIFIGRIPIEATAIDLRSHFSQFGHVMDVYLPKDDTKTSHRGFGFVTFADEISAEYASQKIHKILGQKIILDRAAPQGSTMLSSSAITCATPLAGSLPTLQDLSSQQSYDAKDSRDNSVQKLEAFVGGCYKRHLLSLKKYEVADFTSVDAAHAHPTNTVVVAFTPSSRPLVVPSASAHLRKAAPRFAEASSCIWTARSCQLSRRQHPLRARESTRESWKSEMLLAIQTGQTRPHQSLTTYKTSRLVVGISQSKMWAHNKRGSEPPSPQEFPNAASKPKTGFRAFFWTVARKLKDEQMGNLIPPCIPAIFPFERK